jgi:hypothetical protein
VSVLLLLCFWCEGVSFSPADLVLTCTVQASVDRGWMLCCQGITPGCSSPAPLPCPCYGVAGPCGGWAVVGGASAVDPVTPWLASLHSHHQDCTSRHAIAIMLQGETCLLSGL